MKKKEEYDLAIIVPLEEELEQVFEVFPSRNDKSTDTFLIHEVNTGTQGVSAILIQCREMGRSAARSAAKHIFTTYRISIGVCLGIAGGLSKDLSLGDVCYTGDLIECSENTKVSDSKGGGVKIALSSKTYSSKEQITCALNYARTQPNNKKIYKKWQRECSKFAQDLIPEEVSTSRGKEKIQEPISLNGPIVCGPVSASDEFNEQVRSIHRNVLAIETESGEVFVEGRNHAVPVLTVRGISDYADSSKSKLEKKSKGSARKVAARNAAKFLQFQLKNEYFSRQIYVHRAGAQQSFDFENGGITEVDSINEARDDLQQLIYSELSELSPEYRSIPKGLRLPYQRLQLENELKTDTHIEDEEPRHLNEIISYENNLYITLPKRYPDNSLPWLLASELLTAVNENQHLVPLVIDGSEIGPPKKNFRQRCSNLLDVFNKRPGFQIVFIIHSIPYHSKQKLKFLEGELTKYPDAKFVFVSDSSQDVVGGADFRFEKKLANYRLSEVSFLQIADFLEITHEMGTAESQVVALRLQDTFNQFDLDAHPTYFAGITREILTALLGANRRSELIELAVAGYLSFAVAADKAETKLSRTTRSNFLKLLVLKTRVEKEKLNQQGVLELATYFADEYDYPIDPLSFINNFVENGILHFENDFVVFSLPFIEHYLLAEELHKQPQKAADYFDCTSSDFDIATFDIFSEIGAHSTVTNKILVMLDDLQTSMVLEDSQHILLGDNLRPAFVTSLDRISRMETALEKAKTALDSNSDDASKKQKLLDVNNKIRKQLRSHDQKEDVEKSEAEDEELHQAFRVWNVGVTLLGSGAEHLTGSEKRNLISKLLSVGEGLLHIWTKRRSEFDIAGFKEKLCEEESIDFFLRDASPSVDRDEIKKMIGSIVDLIEGMMLIQPTQVVLDNLCERARQSVLTKSISATKPDGDVAKLIHALWFSDIDASAGRALVKEVSKDLPDARLLRMTSAFHCLSRSYWRHWKKNDRKLLLEAASDLLSPISLKLPNKAEIIRRIEKG